MQFDTKDHVLFSTVSSQIGMVWKAKLVFVLLQYNLTSYQIHFAKQNSPNKIYWTKNCTKPNLLKQIYQTESNPLSKMSEMWRTKYTKQNPVNETYKTNSAHPFLPNQI